MFALLQPARKLGNGVAAIQSGIAGANRVFSILDLNIPKTKKENLINIKSFSDTIKFNKVNFKYSEESDYVLKNISATIRKGEKIALLAPITT